MLTHTIYHVVGRKVGCTKNLKRRRQEYKSAWGFDPIIRILEELYDKTDQEAGDIEILWNDHFNYKRASHYTQTISAALIAGRAPGSYGNLTLEQRIQAGHKSAFTGGCSMRDRCPHCGLESARPILHRWHFDNCPKVRVNPATPSAVQTLMADNVK